MRVLITGAAGFIGSALAIALASRGDEVIGLDNFSVRRTESDSNARYSPNQSFRLEAGDVRDASLLRGLLQKIDAVIHLAGLSGVRSSLIDPAKVIRENVEGTSVILDACKDREVHRVLIASSASVYGPKSQLPFSEDDPCDSPLSPYAASKRSAEYLGSVYNHLFDIGVSCLRYFSVYGPGQDREAAIHCFTRQALASKPIPVFGNVYSKRDYVFISDVVEGTISALDHLDCDFRIYNLGTSVPVALGLLIREILELTSSDSEISLLDPHPAELDCAWADISRASRELGYAPRIALTQGLKLFISWYRAIGHRS